MRTSTDKADEDEVEMLSTWCGSVTYAVPELVVDGHDKGVERLEMRTDVAFTKGENSINEKGWFDNRATDTRRPCLHAGFRALPFGEGVPKLEQRGKGERLGGREREGEEERMRGLMRYLLVLVFLQPSLASI